MAALAARYIGPDLRKDLVAWAKQKLDVDVWSLQGQIGNDQSKRVYVRSCHNSGKCAAADEWLPLADGSRIRFGDAIGRDDLTVVAWDEVTGKQVPAPAVATDNGTRPVYALSTDKHRTIRRTAEHPLWVGSRDRLMRPRGVKVAGWTPVAEIVPGDVVLVPTALPHLGTRRVDDDEVSLLGYLIADGSLSSVAVGMTKKEGPVRQHFQGIAARMGCKVTLADKNDQTMMVRAGTYHGTNKVLDIVTEWGLLGHKSADKFLPDWVWTLPDDQLALLARSLFDCDGYLRPDGAGYSTISERLIHDVEYLMLRLGIAGAAARVYKYVKAAGRMYESFVWEAVTNRDVEAFALRVGSLQHPDRIEAMLDHAGTRLDRYERRWMLDHAPDGYHWETVRSVVIEEPVPTVALSVPGYHTYLTQFVEHNTFLAALKACHWIDTHPVGQARVISTAPTNDQVVGLLWMEINQLFERAASRGNPLPGRLTQSEWWIGSYQAGVGRKPSDYSGENFQGYHCLFPLVIADEADALPAPIWDALGTLLTNDNACMFAIGNPDDPTSVFHKMQDAAAELGHTVYQIRAQDTPNFTGEPVSDYIKGVMLGREWVRERISMWGGPRALDAFNLSGDYFGVEVDHPFWQSKVMAEYPQESNLTIVRAADALACMVPNEDEPFGTIALGVDVAGSEQGDETVVRERVGRHALRRWGIRSADPEAIEDFLIGCALESGCTQLVIDAGGIGFGFIAGLRRHLPRVAIIPFNFGAGAIKKDTFRNARAELYWHMRTLSRDRGWDLSRMEQAEDTVAQVTSIRRKADAKLILVEAKDDVRARIGKSPDDADALGLAFWSGKSGGEAVVSSGVGTRIPTGSGSVIRGTPVPGGLPTGAAGLTRGPI